MFRMLLAVALGWALAGAGAAAAPPPMSAYGRVPAIENLEISPDGQKLAYLSGATGRSGLVVQTLDGRVVASIAAGETKIRDIEWADDRRIIIITSATSSVPWVNAVADELSTAQVFDLQRRRFTPLLATTRQRALNILASDPVVRTVNGRARVFVEALTFRSGVRDDLYEVNLQTGAGRIVDEGGEDVAARVIGADGTVVARANHDTDLGTWVLSARDGPRWRVIHRLEDVGYDAPALLGLGRDGRSVLFTRGVGDGDGLFELPLEGGEPHLLVQSVGLDRLIHDPVTQRLIAYGLLVGNEEKLTFFDPALEAADRQLRATFKDLRVAIVSMTPDRTKLIVLTDGATDSGTFHFVDMKTRRVVTVGARYPEVTAEHLGEVHYGNYRTADGMEIPAYVTLPPGRQAKDLPLVVIPHGGPQARDEPGFDWLAQAVASRGYVVLQPQFRGSEGFGSAFVAAGYGQWGRKMQTDVSDGILWLAGQGIVDPKRVCIFGWSYGGYAALAGATLQPGVYRCAVAGAGVSDLDRLLRWSAERTGGRDTSTVRYWKHFLGVTEVGDPALDQISPARHAAKADAPILLIHGRDDKIVPYEQTQIMARALEQHRKPHRVVTLAGEDHWLSRADTRVEALTAAVDFIQQHNPP